MKVHEWKKSKAAGDKGEKILIKFLNKQDKIKRVVDLSNKKQYQDKDIDLGLVRVGENNEEIKETAEIKTDSRSNDTGNVFFETHSNLEANTLGCFLKTEADWLLYYCVNENFVYAARMKDLKPWFLKNLDSFADKKLRNKATNGRKAYTTKGKVIPKRSIETLSFVKKYEGIKERANGKS